MKLISNKLAAALAAVSISSPVFALGASVTSALSTTASSRETSFCTELPTTINTVNSNISKLTGKLNTAQATRLSNLNSRWTKADQTLAADRSQWAADRQAQFTKLEAKATTDSQKAAVSTFESTITSAINTRELANDAARATYRTAVTNLVSTKQSGTNGQVAAFTSSVNSAESTATAGCQANPSSAANRTTFQTALRTARTTYISYRNSDNNIASQVKALAQTRDTAIQTNDSTFKAAAAAAETALKAAF